jgi:hypothetical protein
MSRRRRGLIAVLAGTAALAVAGVFAQSSGGVYDLSWRALAGGGKSSGGGFVEQGVAGQAFAKTSTGGNFQVDSGFLGGGAEKFKRVLPFLSKDGSN